MKSEFLDGIVGVGLDVAIIAGAVILASMAFRKFKHGSGRRPAIDIWRLPEGGRRYPDRAYS